MKNGKTVVRSIFGMICTLLILGAFSLNTQASPNVADELPVDITAMDSNADGKVSLLEHRKYWDGKMAEIDGNADGFVDSAEANTALGGDAQDEAQLLIGEMDADLDGKVSAAEHSNFRDSKFIASDTNKDGYLTAEELTIAKDAPAPQVEEEPNL